MEQPPHLSTLLSRPQEEDTKYIQWGVNSPIDNGYPQRSYQKRGNNDSDHLFTNDKKNYVGEEGKPYYTEYSQVNAIDTGFKKLKSNQI